MTFVYDEVSHQMTSSAQGPLLTLPGDYQSEVGCAGDWDPSCLATVLLDADGDGTATFTTSDIPAGSWQVKVAVGRSWDVNYGADGVPGGANITFSSPGGKPITFSYDVATHVLSIEVTDAPLAGLGQWAAQWLDASTVALPADLGGGDPASQVFALHHAPDAGVSVVDGEVVGGESVPLTYDPAGLTDAQLARFPQLSGYLALHLPDGTSRADVESWLTGKVLVSRGDAGGPLVAATGVQIPGVLDDLYAGSRERRHARRHLAPGRADGPGVGADRPAGLAAAVAGRRTPRPTRSAWRCSARTTAPGRCAARGRGRTPRTASRSRSTPRPPTRSRSTT